MPAPNMTLDAIDINQPNYGYTSYINTGIDWAMVGDNWRGYVKGTPYLTSEFTIQLPEASQALIRSNYSENVTLALTTGHGFYPFGPLKTNSSYTVRILKHEYTGLLKSPWKYTENNLSLLWIDSDSEGMPPFEQLQNSPIEGNVTFRDGASENEKIITGIREVDLPPELTLPENHNTTITRGGLPYSVESKRAVKSLAGITSDIEISGSLEKIAYVLRFLLSIGTGVFYINMPDYYLFGKKLPMDYRQIWEVRCVSNPIECTHNYLNNFTIKLKLALEL